MCVCVCVCVCVCGTADNISYIVNHVYTCTSTSLVHGMCIVIVPKAAWAIVLYIINTAQQDVTQLECH